MAEFDSQEFIELVAEMMADAPSAQISNNPTAVYNVSTLRVEGGMLVPHNTKIVFTAPQKSTQVEFEREIAVEDFKEHVVALIDYAGEVDTGWDIDTTIGKFVITGVIAIRPLGVVICHRVRLSR